MDIVKQRIKIGKAISRAREAKGLTVVQLHRMADVSHTVVMDIELGRKGYTMDTFIKVCHVLGLKIDSLKVDKEKISGSKSIT